MNEDLRFRLTPIRSLSIEDSRNVKKVLIELAKIARENAPHKRLEFYLRPIENGEDDTAYVTYDGEVFEVVIDDRMPAGMVLDYAIHEYSHIHSWFYYEEDDHGDEFGKSYAYLYREYLKLYDKYL